MVLSLFAAALALQTPTPTPAPAPAPKPAARPAAEAKTDVVGSDHFLADFDAAVEVAKKEHKDLLVDFTGSDWCGWCIKLHKEVFEFDSFLAGAEKSFVLVALDFPRGDEAKQRVPHAERNEELMKKYGVDSFPTVLLMTPEGDVFARTSYRDGGPDKYLENVKKISANGKKAVVELPLLEKNHPTATGADQEKIVDAAIATLADLGEESPFTERYAKIARTALALDPDNKNGRKLKAVEALLASGQADDDVAAAAVVLDPKNEKSLFEKVVAFKVGNVQQKDDAEPALKTLDEFLAVSSFKDVDEGRQVLIRATVISLRALEDRTRAKGYATKLKAIGLDENNEELKKFVEDLLKE
jgi:thioredoxin-related protein